MGSCKADDAQICEDCGALIADGYWPDHTRFHEVVTSLSLDALKRLKQSSGENDPSVKRAPDFIGPDGQEAWL